MTFQRRGITSSVSVMSSPSLDSFAEPQDGQQARRRDYHALARQMSFWRGEQIQEAAE
jgi:hypothetical protein